MRADQLERLFLPGRQSLFDFVPACCPATTPCRTRQRCTLGDYAKQRNTVDRLQILWLPDPPVELLKQEGSAQAEQQAKQGAEDRIPGNPRRGRRRRDARGLREADIAVLHFGE